MTHYTWQQDLKVIYDRVTDRFRGGERNADACVAAEEKSALASIGLQPINVFDYVEDFVPRGEPDWETFLLVAAARRDYFLHEQDRITTTEELRSEELPERAAVLGGIPWLPRIIRKAQCFLEGGLCSDIMFGCGGDRQFLKEHEIHVADFLRVVWAARGDETKILKYVQDRASRLKSPLV